MATPRAPIAPDAFSELLSAHLPALTHLARRYTRNPILAEDLVHDTAERALRFRASFRPGSNFPAWARAILLNTYIHGYRRNKKERDLLLGAFRYDVIEALRSPSSRRAQEQPEEAMADLELSEDVQRALAQLPPEYVEVVVRCDIKGHSYREVAAALNCPLGTVMSRLHRARRLLGEHLCAADRAKSPILRSRAA